MDIAVEFVYVCLVQYSSIVFKKRHRRWNYKVIKIDRFLKNRLHS